MSGEQGQLLKQLLNDGGSGGAGGIRVIRRCAMTTLVSARHQHLVISQDKGKVTGWGCGLRGHWLGVCLRACAVY